MASIIKRQNVLPWFLILGYCLYAFWSYGLLEPNLILSSNQTILNWQKEIIQFKTLNPLVYTFIYLLILLMVSVAYVFLNLKSNKSKWGLFLSSSFILLMANPALSHDVYNYVFNAKMILKYHVDPHVKTALDFSSDPYFPYLHNVHTSAPYGYGFTALSIIPGYFGLENIKLGILAMKIFMFLFLIITLLGLKKLLPEDKQNQIWWLGLHPLVLIETLGNSHNDMVMMGLLVWGLVALKRRWWFLAFGLIMASISIKFASVMILLALVWEKWGRKMFLSFGAKNAIAHYLPLLSAQSKNYLPWYALWSMAFLPLIQERNIKVGFILLGFVSLLSYVPYLLIGQDTQESLKIRALILYLPILSYFLTQLILKISMSNTKAT